MSSNLNLFHERVDAVRAVVRAQGLLRSLDDLNQNPSGKVFARQREERRRLWGELSKEANAMEVKLGQAPTAPKKRVAAKPATKPAVVLGTVDAMSEAVANNLATNL